MILLKETRSSVEGEKANVRRRSVGGFFAGARNAAYESLTTVKANADIFMWPERRKQRVVKDVGTSSLSYVEVVGSEGVEEGRVGCLMPSSRKCDFSDVCDSESDAGGRASKLRSLFSARSELRDCAHRQFLLSFRLQRRFHCQQEESWSCRRLDTWWWRQVTGSMQSYRETTQE